MRRRPFKGRAAVSFCVRVCAPTRAPGTCSASSGRRSRRESARARARAGEAGSGEPGRDDRAPQRRPGRAVAPARSRGSRLGSKRGVGGRGTPEGVARTCVGAGRTALVDRVADRVSSGARERALARSPLSPTGTSVGPECGWCALAAAQQTRVAGYFGARAFFVSACARWITPRVCEAVESGARAERREEGGGRRKKGGSRGRGSESGETASSLSLGRMAEEGREEGRGDGEQGKRDGRGRMEMFDRFFYFADGVVVFCFGVFLTRGPSPPPLPHL